MMDLMYRATDKATWDAYAASKGLTSDGQPTGCYIDEIGPIVTTPAVISEDGTILTPAVMDDRHHVNVRVIHLPTSQTKMAPSPPSAWLTSPLETLMSNGWTPPPWTTRAGYGLAG